MDLLAVYTTVGSREAALKLAQAAVEGRLAACVQITPIESVYAWQGALQQEAEFRLLFKTTQRAHDALVQAIRALHPYQLPALYTLPVAACTDEYRAWVIDNTLAASDRPA
ncbi:MAG: divalent-cation tolerance protein CutA [Burkholderiaceae bacterium]|nr:divalent-cation tolerance protein CutA [Burkholderiaceae bacterium]